MIEARSSSFRHRRWTATAAILAAILGASAARADILVGPEIDLPFLAGSNFPSLALLDDGSFAIAGCQFVQVQAYSRNGLPAGTPFLAEPISLYGGVGSLGNRYFLSWQHLSPKTGAGTTKAAILSRGGEPLAGPFAWPNSEIEDYFLYYRFGGSPDHAFVPVFYHQDGVDRLDDPIWVPSLLEYGQNAMATGHLAPLAKFQPDWQIYIDDVAVNGEGRIVVLSDQCPVNATLPQQCVRGLQIFGPSGRALSPLLTDGIPQTVDSDGSLIGPAGLGLDPKGELLVLWGIGLSNFTIVAQLFDREGRAISGLLPATQLDGDVGLFKVRPISDGHFALAWLVLHEDGTETIKVAEFHTATGFSEPVAIGRGVFPGGFEELLFSVNASGHGVVAWRTIDENLFFHGHAKLITFNRGAAPARGDAGKHQ